MTSGIVVGIAFAVYLVLEIIDRLTASRAMRRRVNRGSDEFFRERGGIWRAAVRATADFLDSIGIRWF